ncbi:MAG: hypothetical protein ACJ75J_11985 [Cytophagaceae bacterium]
MKFISRFLFFLPVLFCCTSCIELIEEVSLKATGSGTYRLTLNMSQSKTKLSTLIKLDTVDGVKVPKISRINELLDELKSVLSNTKGISNVQISRDHENFIYEVSFHFENTDLLDKAVKSTIRTFDKKNRIPDVSNFYYDNITFKRYSYEDYQQINVRQKERFNELLTKSTFTGIYKFEKPVKTSSNPNSKISKSKTAVFFQSNFMDLMNKQKSYANTIKF